MLLIMDGLYHIYPVFCIIISNYIAMGIMLAAIHVQVLDFMKSVEYKARQHLSTTSLQPNEDHQHAIIEDVLQDTSLLDSWDQVCHKIPSRYESYSLELLKEVVKRWTTIRCNSFAKCYTMQQQHQEFVKHGTRRTLKAKNTEKEAQ